MTQETKITDELIRLAARYTDYRIKNLMNLYPCGSRVYGTHNEDSDYDFIAVYNRVEDKNEFKGELIHLTAYSVGEFLKQLRQHEISALECWSLRDSKVPIHNIDFKFSIDIPTLRKSISARASHCFVKAKKKLTVIKDFNPYIGKKSLFHSLRIILFGKQLATWGKIIDFSEANHYYDEIVLSKHDDWEHFKSLWKPEYNRLMTQFRKLAPKE